MDLVQALQEADAQIARVEAAADPAWKHKALEAVKETCLYRADFISDDIWVLGNLPATREDRALGPIMLAAARKGWCRKTDRVRPSARSHGSGKPVWKSNLYTSGEA
jgi:hypothetical protein